MTARDELDVDQRVARVIDRATIPGRDRAPRLAEQLADAERLDVATPHGAVAAWRFGAGPAVLLVHGWRDSARLWDPVMAELRARGRPFVALDLPGHGFSEGERCMTDEVPDADVHAVELDPAAHAWAERNLAGTGVDLRQGDMADAFDDLAGSVDVVTCNPPYVPLTAWESVAPEARDHDPHLALFSGADGLDAMRVLERRARVLLRPGGVVGAEHADVQGESAPAVFAAAGGWSDVRDHPDLAGRARFVTARLAG